MHKIDIQIMHILIINIMLINMIYNTCNCTKYNAYKYHVN